MYVYTCIIYTRYIHSAVILTNVIHIIYIFTNYYYIIGLLGKYNKGRGAVYDWCRETVFYTGQTKQCQCCVLCVCRFIFMGKLFIVCGGLGSFPFIRMVNNKTIVLHLTRTYSCFVFCLVFYFVMVFRHCDRRCYSVVCIW